MGECGKLNEGKSLSVVRVKVEKEKKHTHKHGTLQYENVQQNNTETKNSPH